jgi:hypothetical protein
MNDEARTTHTVQERGECALTVLGKQCSRGDLVVIWPLRQVSHSIQCFAEMKRIVNFQPE